VVEYGGQNRRQSYNGLVVEILLRIACRSGRELDHLILSIPGAGVSGLARLKIGRNLAAREKPDGNPFIGIEYCEYPAVTGVEIGAVRSRIGLNSTSNARHMLAPDK